MKTLIIAIALFAASKVNAQQNRVIYKSTELFNSAIDTSSNIKSIGTNSVFGKYIKVKYKDGTFKKIAKDSIWGIISDGKVYRYFSLYLYEVVDFKSKDMIDYIYTANVYYKKIAVPQTRHSYSKTLDSDIYTSRQKAEKEANKE